MYCLVAMWKSHSFFLTLAEWKLCWSLGNCLTHSENEFFKTPQDNLSQMLGCEAKKITSQSQTTSCKLIFFLTRFYSETQQLTRSWDVLNDIRIHVTWLISMQWRMHTNTSQMRGSTQKGLRSRLNSLPDKQHSFNDNHVYILDQFEGGVKDAIYTRINHR